MRPRHAASLALPVIVFSAQALAAPATPDEAQRLTTLFERYVGHPGGGGAVTVTPDGESYRTVLDLGRMLGFLQQDGLAISASALTARLTPQTDGRWRVAVEGLPALGFTKDGQAGSFVVNGYKLEGLFDPALQAFASASTQASGSTAQTSGPKGTSTVHLTDTSLGSYGATDGGAGTIDVKASQTIKDFDYEVEVTPAADASSAPTVQPVKFSIRGATLASSVALGNARNTALADLWAFMVAHASRDELVAHQVDLKTRLKAVLPLASSIIGDVSLSKLVVNTELGDFGAAEFSEHYELEGPNEKNGIVSTLKLSGLSLPAGLVPSWAAPLTPTGFEVSQIVGPVDVTPSLLMAIDGADLAADNPLTDAQLAAIKASLAQNNSRMRIAPSSISTALMTMRFQSDLKLAKPLPTGTANVAVTGLDKTIDAIRAASPDDPNAEQAIAMLAAVKVLAKAEGADSYSWRIEAKPGGNVTVNGMPLKTESPKPSEGKQPIDEP
jgi:hypothetical protein